LNTLALLFCLKDTTHPSFNLVFLPNADCTDDKGEHPLKVGKQQHTFYNFQVLTGLEKIIFNHPTTMRTCKTQAKYSEYIWKVSEKTQHYDVTCWFGVLFGFLTLSTFFRFLCHSWRVPLVNFGASLPPECSRSLESFNPSPSKQNSLAGWPIQAVTILRTDTIFNRISSKIIMYTP
jgi:hypothetical protein